MGKRIGLWLGVLLGGALLYGAWNASLFTGKPLTPLKIGFSGGLTGRGADLGQDGRDGALLAIEQKNASGGIRGRTVELLIRNDAHQDEVAWKMDQELIDEGVVAVIGHMTSAMSVATVPLFNQNEVLLLSPTTSTNLLSGKKDWFLRLYPDGRIGSIALGEWAATRLNLRKAALVLDLSNRAYTESWAESFEQAFEKKGGQVLTRIHFHSGPDVNFQAIAEQTKKTGCDTVLILANTVDTAILAQKLRPIAPDMTFLASEWSASNQILNYGGRSVEGMVVYHTFSNEHKGERYLAFVKDFNARFGRPPGFAAVKAYDAAQVLLKALELGGTENLRATILEQRTFEGLQTPIRFDEYGDATIGGFIMTIHDGQFQLAVEL